MSAWSIGATSRDTAALELAAATPSLKSFVDKVVRWIPGDVVALYLSAVSTLGVTKPQWWLLIVAILLAPLVVILGSRTLPPEKRLDHIGRRALLSAPAVAIWTLVVPGSGWQNIPAVSSNAGFVSVVAAIAGLVFGLIASNLVPEE